MIVLPPVDHGVGDKDDPVYAFQHQFAGGVVLDLSGNRVELGFYIVAFDSTQFERQKIEKQGSIPLGFDADHVRFDAVPDPAEDIFQIGGFPAPAGTDKDKFDLNFFGFSIYKSHASVPLFDKCGWYRPLTCAGHLVQIFRVCSISTLIFLMTSSIFSLR
jgi:hypothetical protein